MPKPIRTYLLALGAVAVALAARGLLDARLGDQLPLAGVLWALMFAVWIGGWRVGVVAAVVGYAAGCYLFVQPRHTLTFGFGPGHQLGVYAYIPAAATIIAIGEALWRARRRAEEFGRAAQERAEALRDSEQQVRLMTDVLPALIGYVGPDHRYRFMNRTYAEWFGVSTTGAGAAGPHMRDVLGEDVYGRRLPYVEAALRGEFARFEGPSRHRERGEVECEVTYAPDVAADGTVRGFVVHVQDVTARRHAEVERERLLASERAARAEAERASDAKSEFLATLSHELRTPLTPVLLTVSLLESRGDLPAEVRDDVAMIRRNVELESRLIGDLLDLTRIARGMLQLEMGEVDLHEVVRSAVDICRGAGTAAAVVVEFGATRTHLRGDPTRLQQVVWNLLTNAQKFTPAGGRITLRTGDGPGDGRVRIEVTDTGEGIDSAVLPRLFNAFEQGDARDRRQHAGLGLGLAISRRLAEAHGGTITATSRGRGHGSTFTVDLPATVPHVNGRPPAVPRDGSTTSSPAAASADGAPALDVLLVEDHEPTLRVMTRLLRNLGHRVTGAASLATATAAARDGAFDLIISDLGLPDGSGLELMRDVRAMYAGRAIALTGYGTDADVAATREAGFADHLTKPIDRARLSAAIDRVRPR